MTFFLAEADYAPLALEKSGGLDDARWFSLAELSGLRMYDDVTGLVAKAITIIK